MPSTSTCARSPARARVAAPARLQCSKVPAACSSPLAVTVAAPGSAAAGSRRSPGLRSTVSKAACSPSSSSTPASCSGPCGSTRCRASARSFCCDSTSREGSMPARQSPCAISPSSSASPPRPRASSRQRQGSPGAAPNRAGSKPSDCEASVHTGTAADSRSSRLSDTGCGARPAASSFISPRSPLALSCRFAAGAVSVAAIDQVAARSVRKSRPGRYSPLSVSRPRSLSSASASATKPSSTSRRPVAESEAMSISAAPPRSMRRPSMPRCSLRMRSGIGRRGSTSGQVGSTKGWCSAVGSTSTAPWTSRRSSCRRRPSTGSTSGSSSTRSAVKVTPSCE